MKVPCIVWEAFVSWIEKIVWKYKKTELIIHKYMQMYRA